MADYVSAYTGEDVDRAINKSLTEIDTKADKTQLSNRNLLDNAWFTVNQRGQSSYTSSGTNIYTFDRWQLAGGVNFSGANVTKNDDGTITLTYSGSGNVVFRQLNSADFIENGKVYTASVHVTAVSGTVNLELIDYLNQRVYLNLATGVNATTFTASAVSGNPVRNLLVRISGSGSVTIKAVKLEVGSISTLHLDAPPNYAEELLKCQRYFYRLPTLNNTTYSAEQFIAKGSYLIGCVSFPVTMRNSPTITGLESIRRTSTGEIVPINIGYRHHSKSALGLFYGVGGLVEGESYSLYATPYIDFSADL